MARVHQSAEGRQLEAVAIRGGRRPLRLGVADGLEVADTECLLKDVEGAVPEPEAAVLPARL